MYLYRQWVDSLIPQASDLLAEDLSLPVGTPGGMEQYRQTLAASFFYKFYLSVHMELQQVTHNFTITHISYETSSRYISVILSSVLFCSIG